MGEVERKPYEEKAQVEKVSERSLLRRDRSKWNLTFPFFLCYCYLQEEHQRAKAEYIANAGPEKFKLKLRQGKPKRPPTAYFHFLAFMRKTLRVSLRSYSFFFSRTFSFWPTVLQSNPNSNQKPDGKPLEVKEISKKAGEKWRLMTPEERAPYETLAAEAKAKFEVLRKLPPDELAEAMKHESYYN